MNNKTRYSVVDKDGFPVIYSKEEKEAIQYIFSKIDGKFTGRGVIIPHRLLKAGDY